MALDAWVADFKDDLWWFFGLVRGEHVTYEQHESVGIIIGKCNN